MWVPFKVPAKGMEDTDKAGGKEFGFIVLVKHTGDDAVNGREKTGKQRAIF